MATKNEPIKMCYGHKSPILNCIGTRKESDFYNSWSQFGSGKVIYCKDCCNKIFEYFSKYTESKLALYYTLQKIDIPFIMDVYNTCNDRAVNGDKNGKITPLSVGAYIAELLRHTTNKEIWTDFSATDSSMNISEDVVTVRDDKKEELLKYEKKWGKQEEFDDYEFLEDTFIRYTNGVEFVNPQQEDLYRDLCRDRLLLRKINDNRYGGEESIDKVQNRIGKTMSTLKVDQFESTKPKTLSEQSMFTKIAQIEQTKPSDLYKEPRKYKDFNGIKKYYTDLVLRPLLNTLCGHKDFDIDIEDINRYNLEEE